MPESMKPPRRPGFDDKNFSGRLHERVLSEAGKPYAVFDPVDDATGEVIGFPRWSRWIDKLRDAIVGNAKYLDDVANGLGEHVVVDNARHTALANRVAALEEAQQFAPFPGSS